MGGDLNEVVDIRSGLAYVLVKWKYIALAVLVGALIGGCYGSMKSPNARTGASAGFEERLRSARAACSEREALYAEQLSEQYKAYNRELGRWGAYLDNSALQKMDPQDYVKKDVQYVLETDSENVADAFSDALLSTKDQEAISEILGVDPLTASAEELICVSGSSRKDGESEEVAAGGSDRANGVHREFMTVSVAAGDEGQADLIAAVAENAVDAKCKKIQAAGVQLKMEKADESRTDFVFGAG